MPLVIAALALRFDHAERPTRTRLIGMIIGLGGVVALVGLDLGGSSAALVGAAAILGATLGYAIGPLIAKRRFSRFKPLGPVTAAMGAASVMLLPFGIADFPAETPPADAIASVLVLGLVCSALAFILFFGLLAEIGPARASVITYINPVVALALGIAILGEEVTAGAAVGLLLILAGSWLSTDGRLPPGLAAGTRYAATRTAIATPLLAAVIGTELNGRYRLEEKIGSGGMSTVYRAFDPTLERWVAIKLMHRDISDDPDQLERFRREARAVARLSHPHVVTVIDFGEDDGTPYIVLEYVEGETLKDRIRRMGRLPVAEAVAYAIEIGRALSAAHAERLVHRDVKPQNVLIDAEGRGQGHRLRHRPLAGGDGPDGHRPRARHHRLRVARAGARAAT